MDDKSSFMSCLCWVKKGVANKEPFKLCLDEGEFETLLTKRTSNEDSNSDDDEDQSTDLAQLVSFASNKNDSYMKDSDSDASDIENVLIQPFDNLILVAQTKNDASILQVHVYNENPGDFYIHHDIILPELPIVAEWVGHCPESEEPINEKGNLCALGYMDGQAGIDLWELDVLETMLPMVSLKHDSLSEPVVDLCWNSEFTHILASASGQIIQLWDLDRLVLANQIDSHNLRIESIAWHTHEYNLLLSGDTDGCVFLSDCRNCEKNKQFWSVGGSVEQVAFNPLSPFEFLVSTEQGLIKCFDSRASKPLYSLSAHTGLSTYFDISHQTTGLLVTVAMDSELKVWDVRSNKPSLVYSKEMNMGQLRSVRMSPDNANIIALGGEQQFRTFNLATVDSITKTFGVAPVENDEEEELSKSSSPSTISVYSDEIVDDNPFASQHSALEWMLNRSEKSDDFTVKDKTSFKKPKKIKKSEKNDPITDKKTKKLKKKKKVE